MAYEFISGELICMNAERPQNASTETGSVVSNPSVTRNGSEALWSSVIARSLPRRRATSGPASVATSVMTCATEK